MLYNQHPITKVNEETTISCEGTYFLLTAIFIYFAFNNEGLSSLTS